MDDKPTSRRRPPDSLVVGPDSPALTRSRARVPRGGAAGTAVAQEPQARQNGAEVIPGHPRGTLPTADDNASIEPMTGASVSVGNLPSESRQPVEGSESEFTRPGARVHLRRRDPEPVIP